MSKKIPHRNRSPHGWWIASYIERAAWDDEPNPGPNSRCVAWENTIIFQAVNREAGYKKANKLANIPSEFSDLKGKRTGHWVFEGLTSLLPIYGKLEDGAEVLWVEYRDRTVAKVRSWIKAKKELEVFDDTPAEGDRIKP